MIERDLRILQKEFRDMVGFMATAPISEAGAKKSAAIIVEIEKKICETKTQPIDLLRATIATSQLIKRWSQRNLLVSEGRISSVNDEEALASLLENSADKNLSTEELKDITAAFYVARPPLGANRAMELLSRMRTIYADTPLQQPKI